MRGKWKAAGVLLLLSAPHASCSDAPSDCGIQNAPHAEFVPVGASCGEYCEMKCDDGFLDCDTDPENGCETPDERPALHEVVETSSDSSGGCGEPTPVTSVGSCSA